MKMNSSTPIDPDDLKGLIPRLVSQAELNEYENMNITEAMKWISTARKLCVDYPSIETLLHLHKRMFDLTWRWAGSFRTSVKNIGFDPVDIPEAVAQLCEDVKAWLRYETYPPLERAARFHHRLTQVHPFVNGNGRHARLAADVLMICNGARPIIWGTQDPHLSGEVRDQYIDTLRAADEHDYGPLLSYLERLRVDDKRS
jgi:Fic-DOC domain mobile mystery protein B